MGFPKKASGDDRKHQKRDQKNWNSSGQKRILPSQQRVFLKKIRTLGRHRFPLEKSLKLNFDGLGRRIAIVWIGRQALDANFLQIPRDACSIQSGRKTLEIAGCGIHDVVELKGWFSGQQDMQHRTESKNVSPER